MIYSFFINVLGELIFLHQELACAREKPSIFILIADMELKLFLIFVV